MRTLAVVLILAAVGSFVVSIASHRQTLRDSGWTMYTPLSNQATYDEYAGMPADDARLWLGLSIGFAVSAVGAGVVAVRQRRR